MNATDTIQAIQVLQSKVHLLRSALVGMIGVDGAAELGQMQRLIIASNDVPPQERLVALKALNALIGTLPTDGGQTP